MILVELRNLLSEYHSGSLDPERRLEVEQRLLQVQSMPQAYVLAVQVLETAAPAGASEVDFLTVHFAGSILEQAVLKRWDGLAVRERARLRQSLLGACVRLSGNAPPWVLTKLAAVLAGVGRMAWPEADPSFMSDLEGLCNGPSTRAVGLFLLRVTLEELVREDLPLPTLRRRELTHALKAAMPRLLSLLSAAIDGARSSLNHAADASQLGTICGVLRDATRGLLVLVAWAPLTDHLEAVPFSALFGIVETAAAAAAAAGAAAGSGQNGGASPVEVLYEAAGDAMAMVTETLSKKWVPAEMRQFVLQLAGHVLALLRTLQSSGTGASSAAGAAATPAACALDDRLIEQIGECLSVFADRHLGRLLQLAAEQQAAAAAQASGAGGGALGRPQEVLQAFELLRALEVFTLQQRSAKGLRCFVRVWREFAQLACGDAYDDRGRGGASATSIASEHAQSLGGLCDALISRALFVTNGEALSQLEDDGDDASAASGDAASTWEDAEAAACRDARGDDASNELQGFLQEVVELLHSLVPIAPLGKLVAERAVDLFGRVLNELSAAISSGQDHERMAQLACDAATLSSLVSAAAAGGPASDVDQLRHAMTALAEAARGMLAAQLHARGAVYVRLLEKVYRALQSMCPGIANAGADADAETIALVDTLVTVSRAAWEPAAAEAAPAPLVVQRAAGGLLVSLPLRLQPSALMQSEAMMNLLRDAAHVSAKMPIATRGLLYRALGYFLLPPGLLTGGVGSGLLTAAARLRQQNQSKAGNGAQDREADLQQRSSAYKALVAPLLPPLVDGAALVGQNALAGLSGIQSSCLALSVLIETLNAAPTRHKAIVHEAIGPGLPAAAALLEPCLSAARAGTPGAAAAAAAIMKLFITASRNLMAQAGAELITGPVAALVAVFRDGSDSSNSNSNGGGGGRSGLRLLSESYRLLATVAVNRTKATRPLVPETCQLALDTLAEACDPIHGEDAVRSAVAELYPNFLNLVVELLDAHWQCFMVAAFETTEAAATNGQPAGSGSGSLRGFTSQAAASQVSRICSVLLGCVEGGCNGRVPPDAANQGVSLLRRLDQTHALLSRPVVLETWARPLAAACLRGLVQRGHPLMLENLKGLAGALWQASPAVVEQALEGLLRECVGFREERRGALGTLWAAEMGDRGHRFDEALEAFCNDFRFYMMVDGATLEH